VNICDDYIRMLNVVDVDAACFNDAHFRKRSGLSQHPEAIVIDQSAVGISSRSNPATYTGIMDDVRKALFPKGPSQSHTLDELKVGRKTYISRKYARS